MSAYELLRDGADGLDDERRLREELSGVLCRCTGYVGVVDAVRDVAAAYPDGLPAPKALGRPITVRVAHPPLGEEDALKASAAIQPPRAPAGPGAAELTVPEGEPNETVDVSTTVAASLGETWALLQNFPRMSRCMPGVELDTDHGDDTYSGRVRVELGPMRMSFAGAARVIERDVEHRTLRAVASGRDASGSGVRADVTFGAEAAAGGGTAVRATAKLYLSGRAAQFGRSLAGDVSRQLFVEFGACIERTLTTGKAAQPRQVAGGALAWRLVRARARELMRELVRRLRRRAHG